MTSGLSGPGSSAAEAIGRVVSLASWLGCAAGEAMARVVSVSQSGSAGGVVSAGSLAGGSVWLAAAWRALLDPADARWVGGPGVLGGLGRLGRRDADRLVGDVVEFQVLDIALALGVGRRRHEQHEGSQRAEKQRSAGRLKTHKPACFIGLARAAV